MTCSCTEKSCNKTFKLKNTLIQHIISKHKEHLQCDKCPYKNSKKLLTSHKRYYEKSVPSTCPRRGCEVKFNNEHELVNHLQSKHKFDILCRNCGKIKKSNRHTCYCSKCKKQIKSDKRHVCDDSENSEPTNFVNIDSQIEKESGEQIALNSESNLARSRNFNEKISDTVSEYISEQNRAQELRAQELESENQRLKETIKGLKKEKENSRAELEQITTLNESHQEKIKSQKDKIANLHQELQRIKEKYAEDQKENQRLKKNIKHTDSVLTVSTTEIQKSRAVLEEYKGINKILQEDIDTLHQTLQRNHKTIEKRDKTVKTLHSSLLTLKEKNLSQATKIKNLEEKVMRLEFTSESSQNQLDFVNKVSLSASQLVMKFSCATKSCNTDEVRYAF